MKKTMKIEDLKGYVNGVLSGDAPREVKGHMSFMLEHFLLEAGAYKGFDFLSAGVISVEDPDYYNRVYY